MSKEITETWQEFLERYPDLVFVHGHATCQIEKNEIYYILAKI